MGKRNSVSVSLRVPADVDAFVEKMRYKNIVIDGKTITIKKDKASIYLAIIEFGLENAEKIFRSRDE